MKCSTSSWLHLNAGGRLKRLYTAARTTGRITNPRKRIRAGATKTTISVHLRVSFDERRRAGASPRSGRADRVSGPAATAGPDMVGADMGSFLTQRRRGILHLLHDVSGRAVAREEIHDALVHGVPDRRAVLGDEPPLDVGGLRQTVGDRLEVGVLERSLRGRNRRDAGAARGELLLDLFAHDEREQVGALLRSVRRAAEAVAAAECRVGVTRRALDRRE